MNDGDDERDGKKIVDLDDRLSPQADKHLHMELMAIFKSKKNKE